VVKILNASVGGGRFAGAKAVVEAVPPESGGFVGVLAVIGTGERLKMDQAELQTVLPSIGGRVLILAGRRAGSTGTLAAVHADRFVVDVQCGGGGGGGDGEVVRGLEYEHVCKLA
jgi:DNA/RNA-binding protein KIN17